MSEAPHYFEDFQVGDVIDLGSVVVDEGEMSAFTAEWDPALHARPEGRTASGEPVASGWFVGAVTMRMLVDGLLRDTAAQGSSGLEHMQFLGDVRPGDRLSGSYVVLGAEASAKRPEIGKLRVRIETVNQRGEPVASMEAVQFFGRRGR